MRPVARLFASHSQSARFGGTNKRNYGGSIFASPRAMRVLVVLRDPLDLDVVRQRCSDALAESGAVAVAVCFVADVALTFQASLHAQRKVTAVLRGALESRAEDIPVFVVSGDDEDGIGNCAREWGATEVRP